MKLGRAALMPPGRFAVGSFAVLAIYLRQRGSPESKPVGAAHSDTGIEG